MISRSTIVAFAALAVTGCWPVIPGKADDYLLPETALVTGTFSLNTPLGGYWSDPDPAGNAFWGVFSEPRAVTGLETWGVVDTCTRNPTAVNDLAEAFRTGGSGTARLLHDDLEFRMTWNESAKAFFGSVDADDYVADTPYDLASVEFGDLGAFEIPEFVQTGAGDFVVTSPDMTGAEMPVVAGPEALVFSWDSSRQDYAVISVLAIGSDNEQLEDVTCLVEDNGNFTVPADLFQNAGQTAYVIVLIGAVTLEGGTATIGGVEQGYVTSSSFTVQGGLAYGTVEGAP